MRGERHLLRLGEYLVCRACQRLPQDTREERLREWAAELPAILHDPQIRFAPRRAARMLAYAADTLRGAAMTPTTAQSPARGVLPVVPCRWPAGSGSAPGSASAVTHRAGPPVDGGSACGLT